MPVTVAAGTSRQGLELSLVELVLVELEVELIHYPRWQQKKKSHFFFVPEVVPAVDRLTKCAYTVRV